MNSQSKLILILADIFRTNCSFDKLLYQLESLRDLAKHYEMKLAKREGVIEILKSEIAQTQKLAELNITAEQKARKVFAF